MYGIIHKEIFDSTIMAEGYDVVYVFMSMIALSDNDDCVRFAPHALALRINMPLEKVEQAISRLEKPDPCSESREFNGRRVVPIIEIDPASGRGWFLVNREKYISKARAESRNTYMRDLMRKKRGNANNTPPNANSGADVSKELAGVSPQLDHINIDVNINKEKEGVRPKKNAFVKPTCMEVSAYCKERKNTINPESFCDFYESKGWKVGSSPMKNWKAAVRTWEKRDSNGGGKDPFKGAQ